MISHETAVSIWNCHREISVAQKLEDDLHKALKEGRDPTPLDTWGHHRDFQLGVPTGDDRSHRLYKVAPRLALTIIRAHVAEKKAELVTLNEQARVELENPKINTGEDSAFSIIVVDGKSYAWDRLTEPAITYSQVLNLSRFSSDRDVSITYRHGQVEGSLLRDQSVSVEDAMIFNIT